MRYLPRCGENRLHEAFGNDARRDFVWMQEGTFGQSNCGFELAKRDDAPRTPCEMRLDCRVLVPGEIAGPIVR